MFNLLNAKTNSNSIELIKRINVYIETCINLYKGIISPFIHYIITMNLHKGIHHNMKNNIKRDITSFSIQQTIAWARSSTLIRQPLFWATQLLLERNATWEQQPSKSLLPLMTTYLLKKSQVFCFKITHSLEWKYFSYCFDLFLLIYITNIFELIS